MHCRILCYSCPFLCFMIGHDVSLQSQLVPWVIFSFVIRAINQVIDSLRTFQFYACSCNIYRLIVTLLIFLSQNCLYFNIIENRSSAIFLLLHLWTAVTRDESRYNRNEQLCFHLTSIYF